MPYDDWDFDEEYERLALGQLAAHGLTTGPHDATMCIVERST